MHRLALIISLVTGACGLPPAVAIEDAVFDPALEVDLANSVRLPSGVYVRELTPLDKWGTLGEPARDRVTTRQEGSLADGTSLGSSTISFSFGRGEALSGFELGVTGMRTFQERQLIIPPALGYGANGFGQIPGNAILVYRVELLNLP